MTHLQNRTRFAEICKKDARPGYVLDKYEALKDTNISTAVEKLYNHIKSCLAEIRQGWGEDLKQFYIGKSHIKRHCKRRFDIEKSSTWKLGNGINGRYCCHIKQDHGRNGLIVVAGVTKESIPESNVTDGSIKHHEEYALLLEKRLIQEFKKDRELRDKLGSKLANKSLDPGKTDKESSIAYAVYVTFTMSSALQTGSTISPDSIADEIVIDLSGIDSLECSPCSSPCHLPTQTIDAMEYSPTKKPCKPCTDQKHEDVIDLITPEVSDTPFFQPVSCHLPSPKLLKLELVHSQKIGGPQTSLTLQNPVCGQKISSSTTSQEQKLDRKTSPMCGQKVGGSTNLQNCACGEKIISSPTSQEHRKTSPMYGQKNGCSTNSQNPVHSQKISSSPTSQEHNFDQKTSPMCSRKIGSSTNTQDPVCRQKIKGSRKSSQKQKFHQKTEGSPVSANVQEPIVHSPKIGGSLDLQEHHKIIGGTTLSNSPVASTAFKFNKETGEYELTDVEKNDVPASATGTSIIEREI